VQKRPAAVRAVAAVAAVVASGRCGMAYHASIAYV